MEHDDSERADDEQFRKDLVEMPHDQVLVSWMDEFDIEIVNDEDEFLNQIDWVMREDDRLMLME